MGDHQDLRRRNARRPRGFLVTDAGGNPVVMPFSEWPGASSPGGPPVPVPPVGAGELLVADGVGPPPEPLYSEDGTDFLYSDGA